MYKSPHLNPYNQDWPNTIAICAIMKGESEHDVKEFLEYHRYAFALSHLHRRFPTMLLGI